MESCAWARGRGSICANTGDSGGRRRLVLTLWGETHEVESRLPSGIVNWRIFVAREMLRPLPTEWTYCYAVRSKYEKLPWIWLQVIVTRPYSVPHGLNSVTVWFGAL